jgi:hypothetical protein
LELVLELALLPLMTTAVATKMTLATAVAAVPADTRTICTMTVDMAAIEIITMMIDHTRASPESEDEEGVPIIPLRHQT